MALTAPAQTRPPREAHRLDEAALARWLVEHVEGCPSGVITVQQFKGGQSNPTYWIGVEAGARDEGGELQLVLRKKPPGDLLPSAHAVEREYRVMRALDGTGVPVPKMVGLCEDASVVGTPFFVMRFVTGRIFWDPTLPEVASNDERSAIYREYIGALAKLHRVDYRQVGLGDYGKAGGYVGRQVDRWSKQYEASRTSEIPAMEALMAWIREDQPQSDETTLIHGDYRIDNIMMALDEPRALIDVAEEGLRAIARREQLTTEDLADVSVPDLGLDDDGRALLDFGPRRFVLTLGDDLMPRIVDGEGHPVKAVRALKSDDPAKAQISVERLRSLKKNLTEVARRSAFRLEQAMVTGRRWRADFFRLAIAGHPLLGRIARRLVWAREGVRSTERLLVRIAEDGTFADRDDHEQIIEAHHHLRLVHALELDAEETRAWGDVLGDYAMIQPFPQIGRRVFAPTADERAGTELTRFRGLPVLQMALQGRLVARGWERLSDGGNTHGYLRRLKAISAQYLLADPIAFGEPFVNETTVGVVSFSAPVAKVPPILFSEVAYDLHVFAEPS